MPVPKIVDVEAETAACMREVDSINERRADHRDDYMLNLCDDLDAITVIIKTLDQIFTKLVAGFKDLRITRNQDALDALTDETNKYLEYREMLPVFENLQGSINAVADDQSLAEFPKLASSLGVLKTNLQAYRDHLGNGRMTGVGQTEQWNLRTLWEKAKGYSPRGQIGLADMAEQVSGNHNFDLSDRIHKTAGIVKGHAIGIARSVKLAKPESPASKVDRVVLREKLKKHFNLEELRNLCFDLGIECESWSKEAFPRELIAYCERHNRMMELVNKVSGLRQGI